MDRDQTVGFMILVVSLLGIVIYGYLLVNPSTSILLLQITAFVAVLGVLGILGWIGYTMATTPAPTLPETEVSTTEGTTTAPSEPEKS